MVDTYCKHYELKKKGKGKEKKWKAGHVLRFELISDRAIQTAPTTLNVTGYSCL